MKLSLVVTSPGKGEGKVIPVTLSQFLIGRDPQCHLRPASPLVSKRHCALIVREGKAFLRDFDSTNGTSINENPVKGEVELNDKDQLKIGPLAFAVKIERPVPVSKPTPLPTSSKAKDSDDDVAEMLLALGDEGTSPPAGGDKDGVPQGSTVMDLPSPFSQTDSNEPLPPDGAPAEKKKEKAKPEYGNTQTAAKAILEKYTRRQRT